jgi:hypothetical protein
VVNSLTSESNGSDSNADAQAKLVLGLNVSTHLSVRYTKLFHTLAIVLSLYNPVCASIASALAFTTSILYTFPLLPTNTNCHNSFIPLILPSSSQPTTTALPSIALQSAGAASV